MKKWIVLSIITLLIACQSKTESVDLSMYYWKTNFKLSSIEQSFLQENDIDKVYIRYCDVGLKNDLPVPIAPIEWNDEETLPKEVIPVIYIKNEVFLKPNLEINDLVQKLHAYIQQIHSKVSISPTHIQFDCDWSLNSKNQYFEFLKEFKKQTNYDLSATIRLHQIKYFEKTGVPPVDHGVLMYYNMGSIAANDLNSIYDREVALQYISRLSDYPLALDIALPIFSWGVHSREGKIVNVIGGLRAGDFNAISSLKKIKTSTYIVEDEYLYEGRLLQKGDIIKIEEVSEKELLKIAKDLTKYLNQKPKEIILYDLNEKNLENYEKEFFKSVRQGY